MDFKYLTVIIAICIAPLFAQSQSDSLSLQEQLDLLELELDSLTLFSILDSLLQEDPSYSEFVVRTSYNSDLLNSGRNYGIRQQSISPGVSFYHKSGIYADVSGFWNSGSYPKYNLTVFSAGYLGLVGTRWILSASYDRWQYTPSDSSSYSLKNSLNLSAAYSSKYLYSSLDYNFLFGKNDKANRLIFSISGNIKLPSSFFDRVRLAPTATMIYGNSDVILLYSESTVNEYQFGEYLRKNISQEEFEAFVSSVELSEEEKRRIQVINSDSDLSREEKQRRRRRVLAGNEDVQAFISDQLQEDTYTIKNKYGVMNYSVSLPVLITKGRFNFLLSYTYSIPVKLPGESYSLSPIGYFGASVSYRFPLK